MLVARPLLQLLAFRQAPQGGLGGEARQQDRDMALFIYTGLKQFIAFCRYFEDLNYVFTVTDIKCWLSFFSYKCILLY